MKNQKGITLILLILIIIIAILAVVWLFRSNSGNSSIPSASTGIVKEDRSTYIARCSTINYESLARNPLQYKGNYYTFTGEVIQVTNGSNSNETILRVNVTPKRYEYSNETYYDDTILVCYEYSNSYESKILEDDIITLYGQSVGTYTYEAIMGNSVTIPAIYAMYIDINNI